MECANNIQKRIFGGENCSRITSLLIKETKLKNVFILFTDQFKLFKNKDFYKAKKLKKNVF